MTKDKENSFISKYFADKLFNKAELFGIRKHRGQLRKYTNESYYHSHCCPVAELCHERGGSKNMVCAAILHDTLEDTDTTEYELLAEFRAEITSLVCELTDQFTKEDYPSLNRAERKKREAERLGKISEGAKLIKICDLINNTESIVRHDLSFAKTYLREVADILEAFGY